MQNCNRNFSFSSTVLQRNHKRSPPRNPSYMAASVSLKSKLCNCCLSSAPILNGNPATVEARYSPVKLLITYTALGSEKTSAWMCIIRSPPAAYSMTKQTCSDVWKHANRLTRKGCRTLLTVSKILFSHIRLPQRGGDCVSDC